MTKWHKFPEEIPETNDEKLITFDARSVNKKAFFLCIAKFDRRRLSWVHRNKERTKIANDFVTAWMDLPDPYTEEQE